MTLEVSSHHIIDLIKEDIKLNHLVFGMKDIGLECDPELLNLSHVIFKICRIDIDEDFAVVEDYYKSINEYQGKTFKELCEKLPQLSNEIMNRLKN